MEQEVQKIDDISYKVIDYTPTETVYNINNLIEEIASDKQTILNFQKKVADNEALLDKLTQVSND